MRRPFFLLFVNACILIVVLMMLVQSVAVLQLLAVADMLQGTVQVRSGATQPFRELQPGGVIRTGDTIRSGADGTAEFRWADGTRLRLQPNSEITIRRSSLSLKKRSQNSEFLLASGKIFVRIPQKLDAASRFEIDTPTATAKVRGTVFSIAANNGETKVAVWKGRVDVADAREEQVQAVPEGQLLSAGEGRWHLFNAQSTPAKSATREFGSLANIVTPSLGARLILPEMVCKDAAVCTRPAVLVGRAEAGDRVLVNGRDVLVRGDGGFRFQIALQKGNNTFVIAAHDQHGATRTMRQNFVLK
ncbi:MAG TPA: FecR family protein [Abditibacteriaceae bacterium]|nr:FecR family protein [Abditibacteriaceae bacterium]